MTNPDNNRRKKWLVRARALALAREANRTFVPLAIGLVTLIDKLLDVAGKV